MAGEFEEPFAIRFQADALDSGSVSFGRFEKEELDWERRSSFSHNRYLEEVEKFSKPGSVVEKKAYFEAHFKKKGMLLPDTSGVEFAREHRGSNNGSFESGDQEEDDDQLAGSWSDYEGGGALFQSSTDGNHSGQFNEAECELVGGGKDDDPVEASLDDDDLESVEAVVDDLRQAEACRSKRDDLVEDLVGDHDHEEDGDKVPGDGSDGCSDAIVTMKNDRYSNHSGRYSECEVDGSGNDKDVKELSVEDDAHNSVEHNVGDFQPAEARQSTQVELLRSDDRPEEDAASQNGSIRTTGESEKSGNARVKVDRTSALQQPHLSPKIQARTPSKFTLKSHVNGSETSKVSAKIKNHKEKNQLPEKPVPTKSSLLRVHQKNQSAKSVLGSSNTENDAVSQLSGPKKTNTKLYQSENRHEQTASSNNPNEKPNPPGFSFKSEERAERRKQFYTKLEEKLHAKEAEMNQVQARTQEKTEAEMRRFRQSLNFKATPMPSFYHHSTQQIRGGKKAESNPRLAKEKHRSAVQGNGDAKPQPSHEAADKSVTARESASTTDDLPALKMTSNESIREAARKNGSKGKAGPENVNDQSSRHVQPSGKNNDMTKIKMAEGKKKPEVHRSSKKMASKSTMKLPN